MPGPLLIAGFHRSGTSLCAQLLHASGLFLGDELLGAHASNPYGHFEDKEVVNFHDRLLNSAGHAWYLDAGPVSLYDDGHAAWATNFILKRTIAGIAWGFKDPRLCLTLRFWQAVLPHLSMIYVHRNPAHSVTSMWRRAYLDLHEEPQRAAWVNQPFSFDPGLIADVYLHNAASFVSALQTARPNDRIVVVSYDDIVDGTVDLVELVNAKFDFRLIPTPITTVYDRTAVTADIDPVPVDTKRELSLKRMNKTMLALCER